MAKKPKIISLYTGAGGLDYGFEAAGFSTAVCVEMDSDACATLAANRRWRVIPRSIHDVRSDELLESSGLRRGDVDLVIGGPPCQPFSKAAQWRGNRRMHDPRASTVSAFLRVVEETQPHVFVFENVAAFASSSRGDALKFIADEVDRINVATGARYAVSFQVLQAADFGVPQRRARFFLVAARDGTPFIFPRGTHGDVGDGDGPLVAGAQPVRTAWDAIGDLELPADTTELAVTGKWAGLLPSIPEGANYLHHTERGDGEELFGWRRCYWSFLLKLAKDRPSWTIPAKPGPAVGPFHWDNRRLSARELCRLQTFPDEVRVQGGIRSAQKQLGNAVPSLLAEVLGREIRHQLLGRGKIRRPLQLMPPNLSPAPPPKEPGPVEEPYLSMRGKKKAHEGTGKGPAPLTREYGAPAAAG